MDIKAFPRKIIALRVTFWHLPKPPLSKRMGNASIVLFWEKYRQDIYTYTRYMGHVAGIAGYNEE